MLIVRLLGMNAMANEWFAKKGGLKETLGAPKKERRRDGEENDANA